MSDNHFEGGTIPHEPLKASSLDAVSWDVVGGLGEVKKRLCQAVVWPLMHREAFQRLGIKAPQGVLLHGLPGLCACL